MENSKIEWCQHTFNPWIGCTKVSPGCLNCYAETLMDIRYGRAKWGKGNPRSRTSAANWRTPFAWNREAERIGDKPRVFCASLADVFDQEVPADWREELFDMIGKTENLTWLILSKRAEHMERYFRKNPHRLYGNIWPGVTAENQENSNKRVPVLLSIPCDVHFVSVEPMIGPVKMGELSPEWVIVGGESGMSGVREMKQEWVESIKAECQERESNFFFKQWGGIGKMKKLNGREFQGQTWDNIPEMAVR